MSSGRCVRLEIQRHILGEPADYRYRVLVTRSVHEYRSAQGCGPDASAVHENVSGRAWANEL